jgi:hypothetical protein
VSKRESPITRWYWEQVGGLLIEEFPLIRKSRTNAPRYADAVIVLGEQTAICSTNYVDVAGKDVVVVQTKAQRLGMYLMGQTVFSRELMKNHGPKSVLSVALCVKDDLALRPLLEAFEGCEVVIAPAGFG